MAFPSPVSISPLKEKRKMRVFVILPQDGLPIKKEEAV